MRRLLAVLPLLLAVVGLAACGDVDQSADERVGQQPQGADLRITLGTQDFPEARVLGELWRQALAARGFAVDLKKGLGPAEELDRQLEAGAIDGYVAYTGTVLSVIAGQDISGLDADATYAKAKAFYADRDMAMSAMTPFENKDAVATTVAFAQDHGLESIGDLAGVDDVTFGGRPEIEDLELGFVGLQQTYGWSDVAFAPVELGEQYAALDDDSVQAVDAFTTDPQLDSGQYTVLDDPENLFGAQNVVMTVRSAELEKAGGRRFLEVVSDVNRELTQEDMVAMNAAVTDGEDEAAVARRFLAGAGLLSREG